MCRVLWGVRKQTSFGAREERLNWWVHILDSLVLKRRKKKSHTANQERCSGLPRKCLHWGCCIRGSSAKLAETGAPQKLWSDILSMSKPRPREPLVKLVLLGGIKKGPWERLAPFISAADSGSWYLYSDLLLLLICWKENMRIPGSCLIFPFVLCPNPVLPTERHSNFFPSFIWKPLRPSMLNTSIVEMNKIKSPLSGSS